MRGRERILGTRLVIGVYTRVVFDVLRLANPNRFQNALVEENSRDGHRCKGGLLVVYCLPSLGYLSHLQLPRLPRGKEGLSQEFKSL